MNEEGKSVVEIVVVMAVVVIMTALSGAALMAAAAKQQGRAVVTELANELRAARYLAIMRRDRVRVVLEPGTTRMRVETAETPGRLIREYDFHATGVMVERLSSGADIVFHPSGRAASPTTITLTNRQRERWQLTISLIGRVSQV